MKLKKITLIFFTMFVCVLFTTIGIKASNNSIDTQSSTTYTVATEFISLNDYGKTTYYYSDGSQATKETVQIVFKYRIKDSKGNYYTPEYIPTIRLLSDDGEEVSIHWKNVTKSSDGTTFYVRIPLDSFKPNKNYQLQISVSPNEDHYEDFSDYYHHYFYVWTDDNSYINIQADPYDVRFVNDAHKTEFKFFPNTYTVNTQYVSAKPMGNVNYYYANGNTANINCVQVAFKYSIKNTKDNYVITPFFIPNLQIVDETTGDVFDVYWKNITKSADGQTFYANIPYSEFSSLNEYNLQLHVHPNEPTYNTFSNYYKNYFNIWTNKSDATIANNGNYVFSYKNEQSYVQFDLDQIQYSFEESLSNVSVVDDYTFTYPNGSTIDTKALKITYSAYYQDSSGVVASTNYSPDIKLINTTTGQETSISWQNNLRSSGNTFVLYIPESFFIPGNEYKLSIQPTANDHSNPTNPGWHNFYFSNQTQSTMNFPSVTIAINSVNDELTFTASAGKGKVYTLLDYNSYGQSINVYINGYINSGQPANAITLKDSNGNSVFYQTSKNGKNGYSSYTCPTNVNIGAEYQNNCLDNGIPTNSIPDGTYQLQTYYASESSSDQTPNGKTSYPVVSNKYNFNSSSDLVWYSLPYNNERHEVHMYEETDGTIWFSFETIPADEIPANYYDVVVDPGHGDPDPKASAGASTGGFTIEGLSTEKQFNEVFGMYLTASLESEGYKVYNTRPTWSTQISDYGYGTKNQYYGKYARIGIPYEKNATYYISVHHNGSTSNAEGYQVYTSPQTSTTWGDAIASGWYAINDNQSYNGGDGKGSQGGTYKRVYGEGGPCDGNYSMDYYFMLRETGGWATTCKAQSEVYDSEGSYNDNAWRYDKHGAESVLLEIAFTQDYANMNWLYGSNDGYQQYANEIVDSINQLANPNATREIPQPTYTFIPDEDCSECADAEK